MRYTGLSDTEGVKRLLILLLLKLGTLSKEIGMALNINSSIIRRMFPIKEIRKIKEADLGPTSPRIAVDR